MHLTKFHRVILLIVVAVIYIFHAFLFYVSTLGSLIHSNEFIILLIMNLIIHIVLFAHNSNRKSYRLMTLYILLFTVYLINQFIHGSFLDLVGLLYSLPFLAICPIYLLVRAFQATLVKDEI